MKPGWLSEDAARSWGYHHHHSMRTKACAKLQGVQYLPDDVGIFWNRAIKVFIADSVRMEDEDQ